ncbi:uncharacterized protein isoform X2 [Leptinotarsa decemlineata]|uniref:uncharacterized protein isoform X2 n=1 Tax=Leptinotarsa decemlineata TaxID=7539 RepID=UPI003D304DF8
MLNFNLFDMDINNGEKAIKGENDFFTENIAIKTEFIEEEIRKDFLIRCEVCKDSISGTVCIHNMNGSYRDIKNEMIDDQYITTQELEDSKINCNDLKLSLKEENSLDSKELLSHTEDFVKSEIDYVRSEEESDCLYDNCNEIVTDAESRLRFDGLEVSNVEQDSTKESYENLEAVVKISSEEKLIQCNLYPRSFTQFRSLTNHDRSHETETSTSSTVDSVKNEIEYLSKNSAFVGETGMHAGKKPSKCKVCSKSFFDRSNLIRHTRIHAGEKPYECEMCSKTFSDSSALTEHFQIHTSKKIDSIHKGKKTFYKCKVCPKYFFRRSAMVVHSRIHTGEKPYECKICSKSFSQNEALLIHSRIHTGVKPYQCKLCLKSFSQNETLLIHSRIHTGVKPYQCKLCWKSFYSDLHLMAHSSIHN